MDSLNALPDLDKRHFTMMESAFIKKLSVRNVVVNVSGRKLSVDVDVMDDLVDMFICLQVSVNDSPLEIKFTKQFTNLVFSGEGDICTWPEELLFIRWQLLLEGLFFNLYTQGVEIKLESVFLLGDLECGVDDGDSFSETNISLTCDGAVYRCHLQGDERAFSVMNKLLDTCEIRDNSSCIPISLVADILAGFSFLPLNAIRALGVNDLVLMDKTRIPEDGLLMKCAGKCLNLQYLDSVMLSVLSIGILECQENVDTEELKMDVDDIELRVDFVCGRKNVLLSDVKGIEPGYVFELDSPINSLVSIEVNGSSIGSGRIVQVGEQLGVQIVSTVNEQKPDVESEHIRPTEEVA